MLLLILKYITNIYSKCEHQTVKLKASISVLGKKFETMMKEKARTCKRNLQRYNKKQEE